MNKAVILLSGGLDSCTTLAVAKNQSFKSYALSFRYGQRNKCELTAASKAASSIGVKKHIIFDLDLSKFGGSALTDNTTILKNREGLFRQTKKIPATYVPARNTIFLSTALAWAESLQAWNIFIGVNVQDYSGYPDCRPEFIDAFEKMAAVATKAGAEGKKFKIHTPLMNLTKAQIILKGIELGVDYSETWSCYNPSSLGKHCGTCESCILRKKGFKEAKVEDPTEYEI